MPPPKLIRLVLKELTDNALDTGAEVTVGEYDGGFFVEDEGPGLDPDEIAEPVLHREAADLDQDAAVADTGRAFGNGLRVAAGAVLASDGKLVVISRGVRVELKPQRDGTTTVARRSASDRAGTRIEISLGAALPHDPRALIWANLAIWLAKGGGSCVGQSSPYWYDAPQFA